MAPESSSRTIAQRENTAPHTPAKIITDPIYDNPRRASRSALLEQRVLILDGAMGTMLQQRHLTAADFGGSALEGCNEILLRTRPDVVLDIHHAYFTAGSDMVETNSFNGARVSLAEYGCKVRRTN
jgi:methionine synthase I (cobalamin-dependent)